jgi:hypothetical protein
MSFLANHISQLMSDETERVLNTQNFIHVNHDTFYNILNNPTGTDKAIVTELFDNPTYNYSTAIVNIPEVEKGRAIFDIIIQKANMTVIEMEPFAKSHYEHASKILNLTEQGIPYCSILVPDNSSVSTGKGQIFDLLAEGLKKEKKFPFAANYSGVLGKLNAQVYLVKSNAFMLAAVNMADKKAPKTKADSLNHALVLATQKAGERIAEFRKRQEKA